MSYQYQANANTMTALKDIHRGLHVAMDAALQEHDNDKLKIVLHQLDDRLTALINNLQKTTPGRW